jgi:hypothetical protein
MNPNDAYRLSKFRMAELQDEGAANRLANEARKTRNESRVITGAQGERARRRQRLLRRLAAWPVSQFRGVARPLSS